MVTSILLLLLNDDGDDDDNDRRDSVFLLGYTQMPHLWCDFVSSNLCLLSLFDQLS